MNINPDVLLVLEDFSGWRAGSRDFDLLDYVNCVATPDLFFGFLELFCPELILHEGNYFLASHFDERLYVEWMERLGDPIAVQRVMNHIHVSTLFQKQVVSNAVAREAAERLAACWNLVFAEKGLVAESFGSEFDSAEVTLFKSEKLAGV